jgi:hypothetical protein
MTLLSLSVYTDLADRIFPVLAKVRLDNPDRLELVPAQSGVMGFRAGNQRDLTISDVAIAFRRLA